MPGGTANMRFERSPGAIVLYMTIARVVHPIGNLGELMAMAADRIDRILRLYPEDCQPLSAVEIRSPHSFSGARLWRVHSPRGPLCLRRWPAGHPNQERLEFIQAVLWHVQQEGFRRAPLPLETRHHHGYVWHEGHLWELTPWLPGAADYRERTNPARLSAALKTLAEFHNATATFPIPEPGPAVSPGLAERRERLMALLAGRAEQLRDALARTHWPELTSHGQLLLDLFCQTARKLLPTVEAASQIAVGLQPCLRDIWHAHVLFEGDQVTGLVDFGSMRPDNVATDIARLLGSMAVDNRDDWQLGLLAYQGVRRLGENELALVETFDRTAVLISGLQWLEWICLEQREFADRQAVLARVSECLARLQVLANKTSAGQKA